MILTGVTFHFFLNFLSTVWETSRSEHSGTDVATIEAATLKDEAGGSMNE